MKYQRIDGRKADQLREVKISRDFVPVAEGSVLFELGNTRVICTASVEEFVPLFLRGKGEGWITAEYSMIPRATRTRMKREISRGKAGGRTHEIQRLIGRSLRVIADRELLGERTVWIDCDVIEADAGTRCAAICGAYLALHDACWKLVQDGTISSFPLKDLVAAVSVGVVEGEALLDLTYDEDSVAEVDMNIVMTGSGEFVEIQGTAEKQPFGEERLTELIQLAGTGVTKLKEIQQKYEKGCTFSSSAVKQVIDKDDQGKY